MNIKEQKSQIVEEIKGKLTNSKSAILVDYKGLNVAQVTKLRADFRAENVDYKVYKNTLIKRAVDDLGLDSMDDVLHGTTAIAFGVEDAVAPAKILKKAIKDFEKMEFKAGVVDGKVVDVKSVIALADLPSKEELIAKMLGSMNAPITNFVGILTGPVRAFGYALNAIMESKAEN